MTALWTSAQVEQVTQGQSSADWIASGVSIDSRTLEHGDLFVALHGPNFDGHDFISDAFSRGAAAAIVDKEYEGSVLKVKDTMVALEALGRAARQRTSGTIIGVTGSVGKTGSKEALKLALSRQAKTSASLSSLNNHWGVPLSLARMPPKTTYGIFEMGMNHPGEISLLSKMVCPHVALITTVEAVHREFFDSDNAIADAKAEIFSGMEPDGIVVLNCDNKHFHRLASAAQAHGVTEIIRFGTGREADFRLLKTMPESGGTIIHANLAGIELTYRIAVVGYHWALNSLGVLAAIYAAGGDITNAAATLGEMVAGKGRGACYVLHNANGKFTLIDESYNASPVSMKAAIKVLGETKPGNGGRRIAVLGDMLELGHGSASLHAGLADILEKESIDLVFTAGDQMANLAKEINPAMSAGHAENITILEEMVLKEIQQGDVVVVKGSAGSNTSKIVQAFLNLDKKYSDSEYSN